MEVILTLMAWKVLEPSCVHLTRGNHEAMSLNKIYGFEGEVKAKYNQKLMDVFRCAACLPTCLLFSEPAIQALSAHCHCLVTRCVIRGGRACGIVPQSILGT